MTEQEKRELAIARMIKDSEPHETDVTIEQYIDIVRRGGFQSFVRAYDAGYRKEEEVQKETAKAILKEFWGLKWGQSELDNVCIRLAEKFGAEVE